MGQDPQLVGIIAVFLLQEAYMELHSSKAQGVCTSRRMRYLCEICLGLCLHASYHTKYVHEVVWNIECLTMLLQHCEGKSIADTAQWQTVTLHASSVMMLQRASLQQAVIQVSEA